MLQLLTAGTETTPTLMTYAMYRLAYEQGLQNDLRRELGQCRDELCGNKPLNVHELMDKHKMPILQQVISDSLVQHTPTPFALPRQVVDDMTVEGIHFGKKDIVIFNLHRLLRPFHAGQYVCPGKVVAETEASVALAKIFSSVRLEAYPGMSIPPQKPDSIVRIPDRHTPLKVMALSQG